MKIFKKTIALVLTVCMIAALCVSLVGCGDNVTDDNNATSAPTQSPGVTSGTTAAYDISVKSITGRVFSDVDVYVYADDTLTDLKQYGKTNEYGFVSFELPVSNDYAVEIRGIPKGYNVSQSYSFSDKTALITLSSSIVKEEITGSTLFKNGDVMYDFTVTNSNNEQITLSEVLKVKKAVLLNFWYDGCSACELEFPYMQDAYELYKDDIEIIAVSPLDTAVAVKNYQTQRELTFNMATCPYSLAQAFSVTGYPTSVMIDRYGVICVIESGAITSLRPFTSLFEHFASAEYNQKIAESIDDFYAKIKPDKVMPSSDEISNTINTGDIKVTYKPETLSANAEYAWPFIIGEKAGRKCIYASNINAEASYAALYAEIELKAGQAIGFDYIISSETARDILFVIVQKDDIYQLSGNLKPDEWQSCYPWVALEDGTYELALVYSKDDSQNVGDDTFYLSNMRVVDADTIDSDSYIPRTSAIEKSDGTFEYVNIFYNTKDGYYHVNSVDGPLLLADLMNLTMFNEEKTVFDLLYEKETLIEGKNLYDLVVNYLTFASNSSLNGICTVNSELADYLKIIASIFGFEQSENEWLKICRYYEVYGPDKNKQLVDPIQGLAPFSAPEVIQGVGLKDNVFYYDRAIIPRGLMKKFIPTKSGVYRITSHSTSIEGVNSWIFNENREILLTYEHVERLYEDRKNVSMVYYMEAGTAYYINIAFWNVYEVGYIPFDIEYIGSKYDYFRVASPGYYTFDTDATGEHMYDTISGGIKVVLGDDNYYYHDLGKDENGNQIYGSKIYADFKGVTLLNYPFITINNIKGIIDLGGFDFSKSDYDEDILTYFEMNDKDKAKTIEYLKSLWSEMYDTYMTLYHVEDVLNGNYHGTNQDYTDQIKSYVNKMINNPGKENDGCVAVDKQLAEILQLLADKYINPMDYSVEFGWLKLCYYYDYLGN